MAILLINGTKDPRPWLQALNRNIPDVKIFLADDNYDPDAIEFLLYWKAGEVKLRELRHLKAIQSLGAGVEHILQDDIPDHIPVCRLVDPRLTEDMFEYVLAATLVHLKNFLPYGKDQQAGVWRQRPYRTIESTHVSFLGLGEIGSHAAKHFAILGFKVRGWSRTTKSIPGVAAYSGEQGLHDMLRQTDVLISLLPHTGETRGILNKDTLAMLRKGAYLIHAGRGSHLTEADLIPLLDSGQLSGATLDVFETEPLPSGHPFRSHPAIQVTPHVASLTDPETASVIIAENYRRARDGETLLHLVDRKSGY